MRILPFLVLAISFWTHSFAQKDISISDAFIPESKFTIGYEIGIGFHSAKYLNLNFSQGFNVDYQISENWLLGTELKYLVLKDNYNDVLEFVITNEQGDWIATELTVPTTGRFLEIPLNISFRHKRLAFSTGISNCLLIGVRGQIITETPIAEFIINTEEGPIKKIAPDGFRRYHARTHFSATYHFHNGVGLKLKFFQPISDIGKPAAEIPSGNKLFWTSDRKGGLSFHFIYNFPKNLFANWRN